MKLRVLLTLFGLGVMTLTGCGADGEPIPPGPRDDPPGPGVRIDVTGHAEMGIARRW